MAGVTHNKQLRPAPQKTAHTIFPLKKESIASTVFHPGIAIQDELDRARIRELTFKHIFRISFSIFSAALLVWQNYEVFSIIEKAFNTHQLKDLQLIFGTVTAATLIETYFILRIIVNFVFSLSDYKYEDKE